MFTVLIIVKFITCFIGSHADFNTRGCEPACSAFSVSRLCNACKSKNERNRLTPVYMHITRIR